MSGHSKWHNIRLRKGKQDAVRGKLFTRIAKEIIIAAQSGGGSADTNVRLRMAIQTARQNSMPSENIKRAVQRGTGELGGANLVEMVFEGYGQGGVAILVEHKLGDETRALTLGVDVAALPGDVAQK